jgi:hypothetical protein
LQHHANACEVKTNGSEEEEDREEAEEAEEEDREEAEEEEAEEEEEEEEEDKVDDDEEKDPSSESVFRCSSRNVRNPLLSGNALSESKESSTPII